MVDLRFANSIQILLSLAHASRQSDDLRTSAELADSLGTNPALIRKLLVPLNEAGLVETFKGKTGGARLAKAPKQINLRQVYESVVDRDVVCGRENFNPECPIGTCMNKVFGVVASGMEQAMLKHLESTTLQQLLSQVK